MIRYQTSCKFSQGNISTELANVYGSTATNVEIELPVPSDAMSPIIRTSMGYATYAPERDAVVWKIKSFPGNKVEIQQNDVCNVSI